MPKPSPRELDFATRLGNETVPKLLRHLDRLDDLIEADPDMQSPQARKMARVDAPVLAAVAKHRLVDGYMSVGDQETSQQLDQALDMMVDWASPFAATGTPLYQAGEFIVTMDAEPLLYLGTDFSLGMRDIRDLLAKELGNRAREAESRYGAPQEWDKLWATYEEAARVHDDALADEDDSPQVPAGPPDGGAGMGGDVGVHGGPPGLGAGGGNPLDPR